MGYGIKRYEQFKKSKYNILSVNILRKNQRNLNPIDYETSHFYEMIVRQFGEALRKE